MRTTRSPLPNIWRKSGSVMGCSVAVLFKMLFVKWCTSIVHSFSTKTSNLSDIVAVSSAGKLTVLPWTKVPEKVQTEERLGKYSTNFDVLRVLHETDGFAPFVGFSGVAVVTGGTGGIGIPTIDALSRTGMKVVLCTRKDPKQVRLALNRLLPGSWLSDDRIRIQPMDLSDLASVEAAVQQIVSTEKKVDVLLNCAGISSLPSRQLTAQNFEMQLGVNHIAHHFLTRALLPYVTPWGRVVTVTAQAHNKVQNFALDDLNYNTRRYSSYAAYCQSKLGNILFSKALQDKLSASSSSKNIISLSVHPGLVITNMWKQCGDLVVGSISDFISCKTPEQGASTNVFCCVAKEGFVTPGEYFVDCKSSIASSIASDKSYRNKLWEATELMIREAGFSLPDKID